MRYLNMHKKIFALYIFIQNMQFFPLVADILHGFFGIFMLFVTVTMQFVVGSAHRDRRIIEARENASTEADPIKSEG